MPARLVPLNLPAFGVSIFESNHRRGFKLGLHYHDAPQVFYILSGQGRVLLNGLWYPLTSGTLLLMDAGVTHRLEDNPSDPLILYVLAFRPDAIGNSPFHRVLVDEFRRGFQFIPPGQLDVQEIRTHLRRLLYEESTRSHGFEVACLHHLTAVLLSVHRSLQPAEPGGDLNDPRVQLARRYLAEHYFEPISLEMVAQAAGCSVRRLSQLFRQETGESVMEYLARHRIERSKELLARTSHDIASICFTVGYENLSHFYRTFKQMTGLAPKQYRDQANDKSTAK
ncbi:MAG: helix-turn-helix domain-containing protein [Bacillota bacterium]